MKMQHNNIKKKTTTKIGKLKFEFKIKQKTGMYVKCFAAANCKTLFI